MSLSVSPQVLAVQQNTYTSFTLTSTEGDLDQSTTTFTGPTSPTLQPVFFIGTPASPNQAVWQCFVPPDCAGTFPVTITDTVSGDTAALIVSVVPSNISVPGGYGTNEAIQQVQLRTNEPVPTIQGLVLGAITGPQAILILLNVGLQEVVRRIGGIKLQASYPTLVNQTVMALSADVQDIISCSFSTGATTAQGSLVYPMVPMPQAAFMDFAAGFPAVGSGPPTAYFIYQDSNGVQLMQIYPAAQLGYINVYYRARPILWTLMSNGQDGTATNLDPSAQEAVILWTCARILEVRGRSAEADRFDNKCDKIAPPLDLVSSLNRRTEPRSGQVRDLGGRTFPGLWWQKG
jgi:hypothetical protein